MKILQFFLSAFLIFSLPPFSFSQITDNFSDGNFTQNPVWQGDVANFIVNTAGELQLNAPAAGTSVLTAQGNIPDSAIWNLRFRLGFNPSNQNLLRIYLLADQSDLVSANGYFLEIGETGSQDALRFFRQDAGTKTLLATGQPALVAINPDIQLRVKRTKTGTWEIYAANFGSALQFQLSTTDATYGGGANRFLGFQCVYTVSNIDRFFFDDISILPDVPDTQPPVLLSANADDATTVRVVFDENLDSLSAVNMANYDINNGVGQPTSAILLADQRSALLTLAAPLSTGSYTLQTSGVKDVSGNESATQTADFQFVKIDAATEFDILINEIMADPAPSAGLPEVEWFELFNRSSKTIDLATLRIQDETGAPAQLPTFNFLPGTYLVLTATANASVLQAATTGTVIGAPIGVTALNNDGDVLTLSTQAGQIVDRVAYSVDCSSEGGKSDGGWSLERINPDLPCLGFGNWQYCPALPGGTPGAQNASLQTTTDSDSPHLLWAYPESATSVLLVFSEGLEKNAAQEPLSFQFNPLRNIASAEIQPNRAQVRLSLDEPLETGVLYAVLLKTSLEDCSGNAVSTADTAFVGLPQKPEPQDVVLNEVMFNPASGDARYIEFYNRSNKVFDWSEFFIGNFSDGTSIEKLVQNRFSLPGGYDVFTPCPNNVRNTFANTRPEHVLGNELPSMSDNEGNITLYWSKNGETVVVDSFDYSRDFHNALLSVSDRDGVALERINSELPTNAAANWTSASPAKTGAPGTPTLPNSQQAGPPTIESGFISLSALRLSPDDDGYEDFLDIQYSLPQSGFFATLNIFDSEGIPVKRLVRQELIGSEGSLRWDGDLDDGSRAKPGIYVLFLELFAPNGETERVKKAIAVVGRF